MSYEEALKKTSITELKKLRTQCVNKGTDANDEMKAFVYYAAAVWGQEGMVPYAV